MHFPTRPSEMSAEWLSIVLGSEVVEASVETVGVGSGFAGSVYRVHLTPKADQEEGHLPETVIWKTVSTHESTHKLLTQLGVYRSEVDFYSRLAERTSIAPSVYYSDFDDDSGSVCLLLEDLSGMEAGEQIAGCTPDQARRMVVALAELHAEFWSSDRGDDTLDVRTFDNPASTSRRMHSVSWRRVRESTMTIPSGLSVAADLIQTQIPTIRKRLAASPTTLLHGDVRADNAFFDSGGIKLIDWQAVREGRGTYDLAYFVSTSLDEEMRRRSQDGLIERYVTTLASRGVQGYGFPQCLEDFRWALLEVVTFVGMIGAALDFSEGRGLQLANLVMSRLWASIEDNRAVDLLDRPSH